MRPEVMAEWFHRQKYSIVRTSSSYWFEILPHIYQAFPYHWCINPTKDELEQLWKLNKAVALRYSSPVWASTGKLSYHVVFPNNGEQFLLEKIPKKPRHDIKKGLKNFKVEQVSLHSLANEGWDVRYDTLARQKRLKAESQKWWVEMCKNAATLPGFEAWAAFSEQGMAASALVARCDDHAYILYQQSRTCCLRLGVNNTLAFVMSKSLLDDPAIVRIFYGLQSLDAKPGVDQFKFRMGFLAKPVRQVVLFHPYISPWIQPLVFKTMMRFRNFFPGSFVTKAGGMMNFYLEGKKPLDEQQWPGILTNQKAGLQALDLIQEPY
jgi:hypothetical protein